jgi:hypothetical protein
LQGDSAKARTAYQDFLAAWKDADPDVPILIQTKAEYANRKTQRYELHAVPTVARRLQ